MRSKGARRRARMILAGAIALMLTGVLPPRVQGAVTNELVVADPQAGVALFGFDPVSYFLDGAARAGSESFELAFGGLTWRFRSEANRAAFRDRPDAYVPRFGGYDPIALVRGAPVAGHPTMFVVHGGQLYLFHQPENRAKFIAEPNAAIDAARSAWPLVRRSLVH
jgi:YHS domain-containing protein